MIGKVARCVCLPACGPAHLLNRHKHKWTLARRLAATFPQTNTGLTITVVPLHEKVVGPVRHTLLLLLATVGFVLVIACANIANFLLTRAIGRRREIALRIALGASPGQLMRHLAAESVTLAVLGGFCSLMLVYGGLALLKANLPAAGLPRQQEIEMHGAVFGFALLV